VQAAEFFKLVPNSGIRGHKYKICNKNSTTRVRSAFFCERVVNDRNSLAVSSILVLLEVSQALSNSIIFLNFLDVLILFLRGSCKCTLWFSVMLHCNVLSSYICIGLSRYIAITNLSIIAVFVEYLRQFLIDLNQIYRHSSVPKNTSP